MCCWVRLHSGWAGSLHYGSTVAWVVSHVMPLDITVWQFARNVSGYKCTIVSSMRKAPARVVFGIPVAAAVP